MSPTIMLAAAVLAVVQAMAAGAVSLVAVVLTIVSLIFLAMKELLMPSRLRFINSMEKLRVVVSNCKIDTKR